MRHHPKKGQPVKVSSGPLAGRYFIITDFLVAQFQGKSIEKIAKVHAALLAPMINRGYPVDADVVFGKLYPDMKPTCLHDKELQVDVKIVDTGADTGPVELPPNIESMATARTKKAKKKEKPNDAK